MRRTLNNNILKLFTILSLYLITNIIMSTSKHVVTPNGDANIAHFRDSRSTFRVIRVVVHTTGRQPSGMSDNHVSIFLLLNNGAIRLNMTTAEGSISGDLVWSREEYQTSNSQITSFDITLASAVEVGTLYSHIRSWGLQRYTFSGGGSGCRYWV
ncbi:hypothetical protein DM02DRAFT_619998 [Periconia macrospinosa]|uniref:DUF7770 domain-containing protein n=1 Tax=Periconia macrospinosa TaxID=97972 RepID=A0A2V1D2V5_9PLEO|nr:hypothetical protein DM02DRAFT_619998 [Periconia macrospinosa]